MIMDEEMLLLLRELEQKGVEFTATLQSLVLYNICVSYAVSLARKIYR